MLVLLIVGPKCTLAASHAASWRVTVSMLTGQTNRRTEARPLHYAFRYGIGQRNKTTPDATSDNEVKLILAICQTTDSHCMHWNCMDRLETLSSIEVRPTALLRYHTYMRWTYTFDIDLWPWLSIPDELLSWPTRTKSQVQRSVGSTNGQTDRRYRLFCLPG